MKTAFEPKHAVHPARTGPQTLLSLAQTNLQLADNIKFRLLGPLLSGEDGVGAGTVDALSPAEAYAFQVRFSVYPSLCLPGMLYRPLRLTPSRYALLPAEACAIQLCFNAYPCLHFIAC